MTEGMDLGNRARGARRPVLVTLTGDEHYYPAVKAVLGEIRELNIEIISDQALLHGTGAGHVVLMAILDDANKESWRQELRNRKSTGQYAFIVGLVANRSPELSRAAFRAGADDVLNLPPTPEETLQSLLRMSELSRRNEKITDKLVCSLVSISGGVGVSHIAANLGLAIRRILDKRTALVELDLQAAPLAVLLNADPERTISELADPTSSVDSMRLESVLCKHDSGLYWLAAPKRIEEAELISAATVESTMKVLCELFEVVLVDCGSSITESLLAAWERSDHLLYVIDQSITAIRGAQRFLELYRRLGLKDMQPSIVINRYVADSALTPQRIEAALGRPVFAKVPRDDRAFAAMQLSGHDVGALPAGSALRKSFEILVRKLLAPDDEDSPESRPGLIGKLLANLHLARGAQNGAD